MYSLPLAWASVMVRVLGVGGVEDGDGGDERVDVWDGGVDGDDSGCRGVVRWVMRIWLGGIGGLGVSLKQVSQTKW